MVVLVASVPVSAFTMISDVQLAMAANFLGILMFLLVVLFHFISANAPAANAAPAAGKAHQH